MCSITQINAKYKNNQNPYQFFVIPGNGPTLFSILDIEVLEIPAIRCKTTETRQKVREINEQMVEKECFPKNQILIKASNNHRCTVDYFLPGPVKEAGKRVSAKIPTLIYDEFLDFFSGIGCFESTG